MQVRNRLRRDAQEGGLITIRHNEITHFLLSGYDAYPNVLDDLALRVHPSPLDSSPPRV